MDTGDSPLSQDLANADIWWDMVKSSFDGRDPTYAASKNISSSPSNQSPTSEQSNDAGSHSVVTSNISSGAIEEFKRFEALALDHPHSVAAKSSDQLDESRTLGVKKLAEVVPRTRSSQTSFPTEAGLVPKTRDGALEKVSRIVSQPGQQLSVQDRPVSGREDRSGRQADYVPSEYLQLSGIPIRTNDSTHRHHGVSRQVEFDPQYQEVLLPEIALPNTTVPLSGPVNLIPPTMISIAAPTQTSSSPVHHPSPPLPTNLGGQNVSFDNKSLLCMISRMIFFATIVLWIS